MTLVVEQKIGKNWALLNQLHKEEDERSNRRNYGAERRQLIKQGTWEQELVERKFARYKKAGDKRKAKREETLARKRRVEDEVARRIKQDNGTMIYLSVPRNMIYLNVYK